MDVDVDDHEFSTASTRPVHGMLTTLGMTGVSCACRPPSPEICVNPVEGSVDYPKLINNSLPKGCGKIVDNPWTSGG